MIRWAKTLSPRRKSVVVFAYKIVICAVALYVAWLLVRMAQTGRTNVLSGRIGGAVKQHKDLAWALGVSTIALVTLVEAGVRMRGTAVKHDALFWVHAACALVYTLGLLALFRFDGHYAAHRYVAYATMAAYFGLLTLGIPMLFTRF